MTSDFWLETSKLALLRLTTTNDFKIFLANKQFMESLGVRKNSSTKDE